MKGGENVSRKRKTYNKSKTAESNFTYVPVYNKSQYDKDEYSFSQALKNGDLDKTAFKRLMIHDLSLNTKLIDGSLYIGDCYKIDDIKRAIRFPKTHWRLLMALSEKLMHISPHYYRLNMFFGNMAVFDWGIDLFDIKENADVEKIKKSYFTLSSKFESMSLKHEFLKIMRILPYQDIYCGLLVEDSNSCFVQQVNFNLCKLYQREEGIYNFIINLSMVNADNYTSFPDYVREAYDEYIKNPSIGSWYYPPADKQICIKLNDQWLYPFPMLIGMIEDLFDLDLYKKLKLQSARTDNYKAIMVKVPIDESTVDKPLLTPETLGIFAEINRESMSDDIGLIHTLGSTGEAISFKDSSNTRNNVSDSIDNIYDTSGVTKEAFNGSSSATAVTFSIENDSAFIYALYRQFERWTNRFIKLRKYSKQNYKFNFYILDSTIFNKDTVIKRYKESCTLGLPVIDKYLSSLGLTPSRVMGSFVLHENIFDYSSHFKPLTSTYNSSSPTGGEAGRPTNASQGKILSNDGENTSDNDANADR